MALVTFTSDFGHGDHYVAAVKGALLSQEPTLNIVDISHAIKPFDIAHMA
ncbi:MAG: S-adenosylmethionine hydrolase, partial [Roseivirga sp.]